MKCIEINERKFLPALFFYANFYAVNIQNKVLFISIIEEIENFYLNRLIEHKLPNTLLNIRAKELKVRHILDNSSEVHLVSQFILGVAQISYK